MDVLGYNLNLAMMATLLKRTDTEMSFIRIELD